MNVFPTLRLREGAEEGAVARNALRALHNAGDAAGLNGDGVEPSASRVTRTRGDWTDLRGVASGEGADRDEADERGVRLVTSCVKGSGAAECHRATIGVNRPAEIDLESRREQAALRDRLARG